jgi:hypothetical protein
MADVAKITAKKNDSIELTFTNGAASQTVVADRDN